MSEIIETLSTIEYLRKQMHILADAIGLSHPQVIETSQLLDKEIIKYYNLSQN